VNKYDVTVCETVAAEPGPRHQRQMSQDQPKTPREQLARQATEAYKS